MRASLNRWLVVTQAVLLSLGAIACGGEQHSSQQQPPPIDVPVDQSHCLSLSEDAIDFGAASASCEFREHTVTVLNKCSTPVPLTSVKASPELQSFVRVQVPAPLPSVREMGWFRFQVRYVPTAVEQVAGTLAVESAQQKLSLNMKGQGVDGTRTQVDEITIPSKAPQVDMLFVIDNSPAMANYQASLKEQFANVLTKLQQTGYQFHLAVTTTDMSATGAAGRFLPLDSSSPRVLTNDTPDIEQLFAERVSVGTSGSSQTMGLEAVRTALDPVMLEGNNNDFVRPTARLSVVLVTATEDASTGSFDAYYQALMNVKGFRNVDLFSFSSVFHWNDGYPKAYMQMSQGTGGHITDIDTAHWAGDLFAVNYSDFGRRSYQWLSAVPSDPKAIHVSLDSYPMPPTQGNFTIWTYEPMMNALAFDAIAAPEPDSVLRIEYPVACTAAE